MPTKRVAMEIYARASSEVTPESLRGLGRTLNLMPYCCTLLLYLQPDAPVRNLNASLTRRFVNLRPLRPE
jgi:hypothetical protein